MKKKEKESRKQEENALIPRGQLLRLKRLFSIRSGNGANAVNNSRLN